MPKTLGDSLKATLRHAALALPWIRDWRDRGYFSPDVRRQRFVNYFFKAVFRMNADCPWSVHYTSRVVSPDRIRIGKDVERSFMQSGSCYIQGGNGIEIGEGTVFGPGVKIVSANHDPKDLDRWLPDPPIHIGRNCWIGANAIILPGVELGDGVTVGAGAVVTRSFPAGAIAVGNPARALPEEPRADEVSDG